MNFLTNRPLINHNFMDESKFADDEFVTSEDVERIVDRHRFFPYMSMTSVANLDITVAEFERLVMDLCQVQSEVERLRNEWAIFDSAPSSHWMDPLVTMGFGRTYAQVVTGVLLRDDPVTHISLLWDRFSRDNYVRIFMAEVFRQDRKAHLYDRRFANDFSGAFCNGASPVFQSNVILRASVVGGTDPRRVRTMAAFVCEHFQYCRHLYWIRTHISNLGLNDVPQKLARTVAEMVPGSPMLTPPPRDNEIAAKLAADMFADPDHVKAIISAFRDN
jgi:hypothetical protein